MVAGEREDVYHVLLSGRANVVIEGQLTRELFPGDAFGEISVLHGVPRTASVIANRTARVISIDGDAVRAALRERNRSAVDPLIA